MAIFINASCSDTKNVFQEIQLLNQFLEPYNAIFYNVFHLNNPLFHEVFRHVFSMPLQDLRINTYSFKNGFPQFINAFFFCSSGNTLSAQAFEGTATIDQLLYRIAYIDATFSVQYQMPFGICNPFGSIHFLISRARGNDG